MWNLMEGLEKMMPGSRFAFQRPNREDGKDMAIAIVTPLMKRVHETVSQAAEVMFVDSTSHVDVINTSVTLMLTWSPAGAVPLGVLLTDSQSEKAYKGGFELWKTILPEKAFYGANAPSIIMTDDSDAERGALSTCFPTSRCLLCQFHVQQAIWRWLWDSNHHIAKEHRPELMRMFKNIVNAESLETFDDAVKDLRNNSVAKKTTYLLST